MEPTSPLDSIYNGKLVATAAAATAVSKLSGEAIKGSSAKVNKLRYKIAASVVNPAAKRTALESFFYPLKIIAETYFCDITGRAWGGSNY